MSGGEGLRCVRYELTQREFRRLRREEWSPSFISKLGKLASKLYTELYGKGPSKEDAWDDQEPVNVYPYGILEQAYRQLIEAGEQIGEPYREPDPALKPKKKKPKKKRYPSELARRWANTYEKGGPVWNNLVKKVAERVAAAAAGTLTNENENNEDNEDEEWVTVERWDWERRRRG
jgi:hypothetical protein